MWTEKYDLPYVEQFAHQEKTGGYNEFPPHWREINGSVFAQSRHFTFAPVLVEFRQMMRPFGAFDTSKDTPAVSTHLFWQANGTGYAIVNDYWGKTVKFYTFGSIPEGFVEHFDSSD